MKAMKNTKALIAVALFVATLLFTAYTNETRPENGKWQQTEPRRSVLLYFSWLSFFK